MGRGGSGGELEGGIGLTFDMKDGISSRLLRSDLKMPFCLDITNQIEISTPAVKVCKRLYSLVRIFRKLIIVPGDTIKQIDINYESYTILDI